MFASTVHNFKKITLFRKAEPSPLLQPDHDLYDKMAGRTQADAMTIGLLDCK
jgi:hypothetical protein